MSGSKAAKAGIGYTIGNILIKGISFLSLPIFSRILSTNDFGVYNTFGAYVSIISIFIGLGMSASIRNAEIDYKGRQNSYVSTILKIIFSLSLVLFFVLIICRNIIYDATGFKVLVITMAVLYGFGFSSIQVLNVQLSVSYNYKKYLLVAFVNTFFNIALSVLFILTLFNSDRGTGRIVGASLPLAIIGIIYCIIEWSKTDSRFNLEMAKYALTFGLPLIGHYLSQELAAQSDRIMITQLADYSSTGIYSFIYTLVHIFSIIFYSTDNVWSIWSIHQMEDRNYRDMRIKSKEYVFLIFVVGCAMVACSKELIMLMGPKEYWQGIEMFYPLIIGMFFLFLYTIPVSIEYYFKKTKYIAVMTLISAVVNIVLNFLLIPLYGYRVAAYTTMISYVVLFVSHWFIAKSLLRKTNVKQVFFFVDYLVYIVAFVLVCILTYYLNQLIVLKYIVFFFLFIVFYWFKRDLIRPYIMRVKTK